MNNGIQTIIYPVTDLDKAKAMFHKLLGADPIADSPYYVGWKVAGQDIGLDPNGHKAGLTSPVGYYHVSDIKGVLQGLVDSGATVLQEVRHVGGGRHIASVKDADGNIIGILEDTPPAKKEG